MIEKCLLSSNSWSTGVTTSKVPNTLFKYIPITRTSKSLWSSKSSIIVKPARLNFLQTIILYWYTYSIKRILLMISLIISIIWKMSRFLSTFSFSNQLYECYNLMNCYYKWQMMKVTFISHLINYSYYHYWKLIEIILKCMSI